MTSDSSTFVTKLFLAGILLIPLSFLSACNGSDKSVSEATQSERIPGSIVVGSGSIEKVAGENSSDTPNDIPKNVYWGDSHLHSSYSTDASLFGNRLGPEQAYRFAKGQTVVSSTGIEARIKRPLDWLVVADHAENLGLGPMAVEGNPLLLADSWGKKFYAAFKKGDFQGAYALWVTAKVDPFPNPEAARTMWDRMLSYSRVENVPGEFTALLGYEWSSTPGRNNLHRVLVFADNEDRVGQVLPFSSHDSNDPEDLWAWMARYETSTGGRVLAIPHNGNLSNGLMFDDTTFSGKPLSLEYAQQRARWEPLYETTQYKGDAETHPFLSPDDEFADYETWDKGNMGHGAKTNAMLANEYSRAILKRGLRYEQQLGVNPFKFGLIGATDSHTSLSTTREDNYFGKVSMLEPGQFPARWEKSITGSMPAVPGETEQPKQYGIEIVSSGLQGVWAQENTRTALFDAMKRKETYATTGTRIKVRVFAGKDFTDADLKADNFAERGYQQGVPMGGDLSGLVTKEAPRLMIQVAKDPDGANLDRVQVIKGWLDGRGELHEKVIDVICGPDIQGTRDMIQYAKGTPRCNRELASTVDTATATYENTIGATMFKVLWVDDDFNESHRAFYYVRVLEIPTPRWSTYDAVKYKLPLSDKVKAEQQERAYTSPIWYTPAG